MTTEPTRPTADDLARWRVLADAATPGEITLEADADGPPYDLYAPVIGPIGVMFGERDAAFYAAARAAVPALLAEVERLKGDVSYLLGAQSSQLKRADALINERSTALDRLATLLPLARAAVACWIECEMYNLQPRPPWRTLIDAVGALSPELRAELEADDGDVD